MTSFNLNYLLKAVHPNMVTLGVRATTYEFGEARVQSIAPRFNASLPPFSHVILDMLFNFSAVSFLLCKW